MIADDYHLEEITAYLDVPGLRISSFELRLFIAMGDRAAAGILKSLFPGEDLARTLTTLRAIQSISEP